MPTRTIACHKCGQPYQTRSKLTKYCKVCQLVRDLEFVEQINMKNRTCDVCDREFRPIARNKTKGLEKCEECRHRAITQRNVVKGDCAVCGTSDTDLVCEGVALCLRCLGDPYHRTLILKALAKKQMERATMGGVHVPE